MDIEKFSSNNGTLGNIEFNFIDKTVTFDRNGNTFGLESMKVSFNDITDIEVSPPKLLMAPGFCLILNGNRYMKDPNQMVTEFVFRKNEYDRAEKVFSRLVKECNLSGIKPFKSVSASIKTYDGQFTIKPREHRIRCNTCGKIYCYTDADIQKNMEHAKLAFNYSVMSLGESLGGTRLGSYSASARSNEESSKIIDYDKCPSCNSVDITELTDEQYNAELKKASIVQQPTSPADELKKFKELLDMGIISQEEFDAKKKQLLGL